MRILITLLSGASLLTSMAQWGPPVTIANSEVLSGTDLITGDLDGDGDEDVFIGSLIPDQEVRFFAFVNDGLWQFSDPIPVVFPEFSYFGFHELLDIDGDGLADLTGYSQNPFWFKNLGNFQFGPPQPIVEASAYQFCDLDGQNGLDILLVDPNGVPGYHYAHQLAGGGFSAPVPISNEALGPFDDPEERRFLLIDLNGDGIDDLLFIAPGDSPLQVATGTAQGGFDPPQAYYTVPGGLDIQRLTLFDRDPSNGNNGFMISLISPSQSIWFEPTTGLDHTTSVTEAILGEAIDLNADGAQDLWMSPDEFGIVRLNDGTGTFLDPVPVPKADRSWSHSLADMDSDGDPDIVLVQYNADRVAILENQGNGALDVRHVVTEGDLPHPLHVELTDLDQDGDLDVLSCNLGDLRVQWNNGNGSLGAPVILDEQGNKHRFICSDVDEDGDTDVLSVGFWNGVKLHLQGPVGQFTTVVLDDLGPDPVLSMARNARFIDLDLDGDQDLVLSEETTMPQVSLFENQGGGLFAAEVAIGDLTSEVGYVLECLVVDMNGDGLLDRVGDAGGTLGVYLNNGVSLDEPVLCQGTFGKPVMASDLNGDGSIDLMTNAGGDLVVWHATSPFVFSPVQTVPIASLSTSTLTDVDADGRADLVQMNGQRLLVDRATADGLFGPNTEVWDFSATGAPLVMQGEPAWGLAGDVDGDLLVDLMVVTDIGQVELLTNLSNSEFRLSGRLFQDLNNDQVFQPGEPPLPWVDLQVAPDGSSPFTDANGVYTVHASPGTYTLQPAVDPTLWTVTSSVPLQATLTGIAPIATGLDFALVPAQDLSLIDATLTMGTGPCGDSTYLSLSIRNVGTRLAQGTITLQLAPLFEHLVSAPAPDAQAGNTLTWSFDGLAVQEIRSIVAVITAPSSALAGEEWSHTLEVTVLDDEGTVLSTANAALEGTVQCAYDPNDKQVHPKGYGDAGAIAMDTPYLDYTVRFQNTGTAPAFDVVIMDQLDPDLDPERVEVLGFSHTPTQVAITANGSIQFKFLDIMLPDSATDQLGSQGFIHFRIHLREGLPHLTTIPNTAAIYFDLNPPIITNTVHSTLVDCNTWQPELEADGYGVLRAPTGDLYQWFLNGDPIPGAQADSIQITTNGSYTVEVTSTLGCVATTPAIIATDIPETHMELGMMLVPNPFTRYARLIATTPLGPGGQVSLLDLHGRVLWTRATPGGPSLDLDFEGLAPGPYLLRVERVGAAPRVLRALLQ